MRNQKIHDTLSKLAEGLESAGLATRELAELFRPEDEAEPSMWLAPAFVVGEGSVTQALDVHHLDPPPRAWSVQYDFEIPDSPRPDNWALLWWTALHENRSINRRTVLYLFALGNNLVVRSGWVASPEERTRIVYPWKYSPGRYLLTVEADLTDPADINLDIRSLDSGTEAVAMSVSLPIKDLESVPGLRGKGPLEVPYRLVRGHEEGLPTEKPFPGLRYGEMTVEGWS